MPRANFATSTPGQVDVPVRASRAGPSGNVTAGAITELSPSLGSQLITVRNPDPTDGGRRMEVRTVSQEDFDAALAALNGQLSGALTTRLADPTAVPRGLTVFAATARMGVSQPDPAPETLVDSEAESFALSVTSTATVLAVNETLVDEVAGPAPAKPTPARPGRSSATTSLPAHSDGYGQRRNRGVPGISERARLRAARSAGVGKWRTRQVDFRCSADTCRIRNG